MSQTQDRRIDVPPSPCFSKVDATGWQRPPFAVRAGRYDLGVRGNTPTAHELVRRVLADRLVDVGDEEMPRNLSLHLAASRRSGEVRDLHRLYMGHHLVVRTRDPRRAVAALAAYVDAHTHTHDPDRPLVHGTVVVRDGAAHLLPGVFGLVVAMSERRLRDAGYLPVDRPWVELDLDAAQVIVPAPGPHVADVDLPEGIADGSPAPTAPPGVYPLASIAGGLDATPARDVLDLTAVTVNLEQLDAPATIARFAQLLTTLAGATGPANEGLLDLDRRETVRIA